MPSDSLLASQKGTWLVGMCNILQADEGYATLMKLSKRGVTEDLGRKASGEGDEIMAPHPRHSMVRLATGLGSKHSIGLGLGLS